MNDNKLILALKPKDQDENAHKILFVFTHIAIIYIVCIYTCRFGSKTMLII